ncbi:M48 family metalloprotease [Luteimonas notoginsengisoli]|uniref:Putative beta-barrel assembly-enhancing protease n=1 Tax=Luteimonas notoginsengisoli TaxID=1578200 RepID=A0ABV7USK9_9GAMM
MRLTVAVAALMFAVASMCAPAQEGARLPDIGSSAGTVLSPADQKAYGQMMLSQLRNYDYILEDPLVDAWLRGLGNRLAAASDDPRQDFTFFMMKDRQVNAFATVGGYVGVNAGLVLVADTEDEVAGVLGHEIAHVTQSHVLRSVERAQRDSVPILLAMLGAIAIAQSGSSSSGDAAMAAMASAQGIAAQRQINYTRSNESEADRIGIRTMARSGYDPLAMAQMFERMQALERSNQGGEKERTPDYLRSHPVNTTRIAEAKQRAAKMEESGDTRFTPAYTTSDNPLLPSSLQISTAPSGSDSVQFGWVRERLRVLSANTPTAAINEYERMRRSGELTAAQRYGLAHAHLLAGHGAEAAKELVPLLAKYPGDSWLLLAMAQSRARAGDPAAADAIFEDLLARMPRNRAVALTYAGVLAERNNAAAGKRAQDVLRPQLASASDDPLFQSTFARVNEIAGDSIRAGEAWAEAAYLNGRPERALVQLNNLKKRSDLDYYARARIDARIAAITPSVLELRRQGVRDPDLDRQ